MVLETFAPISDNPIVGPPAVAICPTGGRWRLQKLRNKMGHGPYRFRGQMATAVSTGMITDIRESLKEAYLNADGLASLKEMKGYYCSRRKIDHKNDFMQVFAVDMDGAPVFVYLKV
jgi:hypothetical protein